jgi:hypothetical protein
MTTRAGLVVRRYADWGSAVYRPMTSKQPIHQEQAGYVGIVDRRQRLHALERRRVADVRGPNPYFGESHSRRQILKFAPSVPIQPDGVQRGIVSRLLRR